MKKFIYLSLSVLALLSLAACSGKKEEQNNNSNGSSSSQTAVSQYGVGQPAPDFTLESMDGKTVKLSDYKGKKVYLKFWASWCGPCKRSMPELEELAAKEGKDFEILSVVAPGLQGEKSVEDFPKWFAEQGYDHVPVLYDTKAAAFQAYQVRSIPTEVLIDSQGVVRKIHLGAISNQEAEAAFKDMD